MTENTTLDNTEKNPEETAADTAAGTTIDADKAAGAVTADSAKNINANTKIHFIGVGGVGMSGIAKVAKTQGYQVSGSDIRQSYITDNLEKCGVEIMIGNTEDNIKDGQEKPDIVVVSTAILQSNPELRRAKELGIDVWHRSEMLAYLGKDMKTLAVAGTHGKTSTSSMLAATLDELNADPTFLIGGVVRQYGTNARCGSGEYYVIEADESDKSFTHFDPYAAIVTNIEADHLDHYEDLDEIYEKFGAFMGLIIEGGVAVVCGDDKPLVELAEKSTDNVITYGFDEQCDCVIQNYHIHGVGCKFDLKMKAFPYTASNRTSPITVSCTLRQNPGKHYASNAASVIALLDALGYDAKEVADALKKFAGIKRRFDLIGVAKDITVVDDYAHHSTEIASTVKAACNLDFNHVHVVWQPHRYSRIKLLTEVYHDEFAHAFDGADTVIFTDVYAAGEAPIPGVKGSSFLQPIIEAEGPDVPHEIKYVPNRDDLVDTVLSCVQPGDLVITMGAGDITSFAPEILKELVNRG